MNGVVSRRDVLAAGTLAGIGPIASFPKRPLRVVHLTDIHIQPELNAVEGTARAFRHAMGHRPELALIGGDMIMDGFAQTEARTQRQWDLYQQVRRDHLSIPTHHAIGNHDVWGWDQKASGTTGTEARWGKNWFLEEFKQPKTYRSFDHGHWHFVILDNILRTSDGYNGLVDPDQFEWLKRDLAATTKPTLVMSHIPLLSITSVATGYNSQTGEWNVGGDVMTKNLDSIRELLYQNRHVKIALSGHTHLLDRVDYDGVSYLCGGAVCGKWWAGRNDHVDPGYRLLDLNADGTFTEKYIAWGWTDETSG